MDGIQLLAAERRKRILNLLNEHGNVLVTELSKQFNVSEETIRRDLTRLEKESLLVRTHGGAYIEQGITTDVPVWIRESAYLKGKEWIGQKVAEQIDDGETIMLDSSTTSLHVAKKIRNRNHVTVITNSFMTQMELYSVSNIKLISTGGTLRQRSLSYVGPAANRMLSEYYANTAIVSCTGIHLEKGVSDSSEEEAEIRKIMLQNAERKILVIDSTKLNKIGFAAISTLQAFDSVIIDKKLPKEWAEYFERHEIIYDDRDFEA